MKNFANKLRRTRKNLTELKKKVNKFLDDCGYEDKKTRSVYYLIAIICFFGKRPIKKLHAACVINIANSYAGETKC
jgi:hypothetical protein